MVEHWSSNPEDAGSTSQPEGLGVAFFATGPGVGLLMCIFTTLEFPKHNFDFHLWKIVGLTSLDRCCVGRFRHRSTVLDEG